MNRGELVLAGDSLVNTASPTVPIPKTATVEPGSNAATFQAAPTPVDTPQLSRHAFSGGRALPPSLTTCATSTTVYSAKLETDRKPWTGSPVAASEKRVVPSRGMRPGRYDSAEQMLLRGERQSAHPPHCGRNTGTTVSPGATSSTWSPTLSTTLGVWETNRRRKLPCQPTVKLTFV
jgi:hypothetical protein